MEDCGCETKCSSRILETSREYIYENYRKLKTCNEKYLYLSGLIYMENSKEKNPGRRKIFLFHVRVDGLNICVCQKTFENVHGISSKDVGKVLTKVKKNVVCLGTEDKLFVQRSKSNTYIVSTRSRDRVIQHVESVFQQTEVREHLLKGKKFNLAMLYADYKSTLEAERRSDAIKFDDQSEGDENSQETVSSCTYKMIFEEVYPGIIEKLKKEGEIDSGQISRHSRLSMPLEKRNIRSKRRSNETNKRHNLTDQSEESSTKRQMMAANDTTATQEDQECQSSSLYAITDGSNESALYLLPTSTKTFNKTTLVNDVVETVYYV